MTPEIIIALDSPMVPIPRWMLQNCGIKWVKIGWQQLFNESLIKNCIDESFKVMLDMKIDETVDTVAIAVNRAFRLGVTMVTVKNEAALIKAALDNKIKDANKVLTVTKLTSKPANFLLADDEEPNGYIADRMLRAFKYGVDGVICAGLEADFLRTYLRMSDVPVNNPLFVCPGIRNPTDPHDNHMRFCTPEDAITNHPDFIVLGRVLHYAANPLAELKRIIALTQGDNNESPSLSSSLPSQAL
jgi:orotidine-5'-phosphate decarboxylase